jgi:hypothetical protein
LLHLVGRGVRDNPDFPLQAGQQMRKSS